MQHISKTLNGLTITKLFPWACQPENQPQILAAGLTLGVCSTRPPMQQLSQSKCCIRD